MARRPVKMTPERVLTSMYVDAAQLQALRDLSKRTRVPQQVFIREGLGLVLAKYSKEQK